MNATVEDLRPTIIPKSDQLNAEQLLGGPMTVTVTDVRLGSSEEQPVIVHYAGEEGRPFKPCKTMRKLLIHAWGADGRRWVGRAMTLYNDPSVKFGGEDVGGIRISHMTDIKGRIKVSLTSTRGKKAKYEVAQLTTRIAGQIAEITGSPTVEALKHSFGEAYKSTKDAGERAQLKAAYDRRLVDLQKPATPEPSAEPGATPDAPAKTLHDFVEEIDNATGAESAALVIDAARDVLTPSEHEELVEAFKRAWES